MHTESSNSFHGTSPPRLTIFLVSALALSYEILLMRLFSIVQYHHFAFMIISLALLGYGASGSFLTFFRQRLLLHFPAVLITCILLFGISAAACFLGGQHLLFNPDEILWNNHLWLKLFGLYLLLALPFFFAATCIALTFSQYGKKISDIYAADLFGAGLGSVLIIVVLFFVFPQNVLLLLAGMILAVPAVAWLELGLRPRRRALLFLVAAAVPLALPSGWHDLHISPYKAMSQQMRIQGSRIAEQRSSPLGLLTVVENKDVPFRYAPGLSLTAEEEPLDQIGIFIDGDGPSVINRFPDDMGKLANLDMITSALPYHLEEINTVLVFGGSGSGILQALHFNVGEISAVELNPQIVELVKERAEFSGYLLERDDVKLHIGEARSFIRDDSGTFDLIQLPIFDSSSGSSGGLYALHENYLYTVEAMQEYISRLSADGFLCVSSWIKLPPRDSLKFFATALAALKRLGAEEPGDHLVMVRSWQTFTLLIKRSPITGTEINSVKEFCRRRLFDPVYYPGIESHEANRFNILLVPYFYQGAISLLEDPGSFMERYKFSIAPATDDRPYFANFFKWGVLPEILRLKGQGGMALLESGYLILAATLLQALIASLVLILLPVLAVIHTGSRDVAWSSKRIGVYFFAIGLGFLFLEIAFIQKYILFLGHPLYAAAAVLAIFLVFAGMGSHYARQKRFHAVRPVAAILILGSIELIVSGPVFDILGGLSIPARVFAAVIMLGPMAFCMGMPFPLALSEIGRETEGLVPWAWAVNGCASVIAAVLATLLAVHFGFVAVVLASLVLYAIAAAAFPFRDKKD